MPLHHQPKSAACGRACDGRPRGRPDGLSSTETQCGQQGAVHAPRLGVPWGALCAGKRLRFGKGPLPGHRMSDTEDGALQGNSHEGAILLCKAAFLQRRRKTFPASSGHKVRPKQHGI